MRRTVVVAGTAAVLLSLATGWPAPPGRRSAKRWCTRRWPPTAPGTAPARLTHAPCPPRWPRWARAERCRTRPPGQDREGRHRRRWVAAHRITSWQQQQRPAASRSDRPHPVTLERFL